MELTGQKIKAIVVAIDYICSCLYNESDPESISACSKYADLAEKLTCKQVSITIGEIKNICIALDLYIHENGPVPAIYSELLTEFTDSLPHS